MKEWYKEQ